MPTHIVVKEAGVILGCSPIHGGVKIDADTVTAEDKAWNTVRMVVPRMANSFFPIESPAATALYFISRAGFVRGKPQNIALKDSEHRTGVVLPR